MDYFRDFVLLAVAHRRQARGLTKGDAEAVRAARISFDRDSEALSEQSRG